MNTLISLFMVLALSSGLEQSSNSIFDVVPGNQFSHFGRFADYRVNSGALKVEASIDYFTGILFGNFPYHSPEVYRAVVEDLKGSGSVNVTAALKFEYMNFAKFDIEVELVPFLLGLGASFYGYEDNCFWMHAEMQAFILTTRVTKNIAQCGLNFKEQILESQNWMQLWASLLELDYSHLHCEYEESGANQQKWDFLSY